ncbi:MAG: hypothetical protein H7Y11_09410, partial [Armatimonadetes bacterium]|nr:hypothetical protein [Anaerolineae bacterium]
MTNTLNNLTARLGLKPFAYYVRNLFVIVCALLMLVAYGLMSPWVSFSFADFAANFSGGAGFQVPATGGDSATTETDSTLAAPSGFEPPAGFTLPEGFAAPATDATGGGAGGFSVPEGFELPEGFTPPDGFTLPDGAQLPAGGFGGGGLGDSP